MPLQQFSDRPYQGPADLQAMIELVSKRPQEWLTAFPFIVDLQEITGTPEGQASFHLWEDADGNLAAGCLAAFALFDEGFLAFDTAPGLDFDMLAELILDWSLEHLPAATALETNSRAEDTRRMAFLARHGFSTLPDPTIHFIRSLRETVPTPRLPEGFSIRPLRGEEEAAAWIDLHHAAHPDSTMTVDFRLAMMRAPDYQPTLDLVATAPDGRLAAYVMCHYSPAENDLRGQKVGYTDPVATHPEFQRHGLARALLLAGFERLKRLGMDFAEVSTSNGNPGMIKTAESVGYQRCSTTIFFTRAQLEG